MKGSSTDVSPSAGLDRPLRFDTPSYERLLRRVREAGRSFVGFDERDSGVVLHHDVALSLDRALTMARLEATLRISTTYCVPLDAPALDSSTVTFANTVRTLSCLGHEVGLRVDPRDERGEIPSDAVLRRQVEARREVLGRLLDEPVTVVSFRDPTPRLRELELDDVVNASADPTDVPEYRHVTDREWRDGEPFPNGVPERCRLLVHPGLWHPVERTEAGVLDTYRQAAYDRVDAYFDAFDVSTPGT